MSTLEDRVRGSLLGLAYGDVLGCPLETWEQKQIVEVFGEYDGLPEEYPFDKIVEVVPKRLKRLRPIGLHSDDTQQALALISICLSAPRFSRHVFGDWLVEGMRTKAWRGYGRHFNSAVKMLRKGYPPEHAGSASAGIGAAMRISPLGGLYYDDEEELERVVMESSLVTHADLRAAAIAYAVAWGGRGLCARRRSGGDQKLGGRSGVTSPRRPGCTSTRSGASKETPAIRSRAAWRCSWLLRPRTEKSCAI